MSLRLFVIAAALLAGLALAAGGVGGEIAGAPGAPDDASRPGLVAPAPEREPSR